MIILLKNEMMWRMRVTFAGKLPPKIYVTPDIRRKNPGWGDELFNRSIERLEFFLPTGHILTLSGMEKYNFFVEAVQSTKTRGKAVIKAFYFCGKIPGKNIVEMYKIINPHPPIEKGEIVRSREQWGHEWNDGPTRGWKQGISGNRIISRIEI